MRADENPAPFAELNEALAAARARLEELSKAAAVAAAAGQARQDLETIKQENQRLQSELASVRASRDELREAGQGDAARLAELTQAAEEAVAEAKRIEEELVTMRWQNAQLNTSLSRARAARERTEEEARVAQAALTTKVETLSASAERSAAEIARLRQELDAAGQRLEAADEAEGRLADLQAKLQSAETISRGLDGQLARLREQMDEVAQERDRALQRAAEVESEAERLRSALSGAKDEVERVMADRSALEREVEMLRAAASSAADAARQNLVAVEERIRELNAALAVIEPAAGESAFGPATGAVQTIVGAPGTGAEAGRSSSTEPAGQPATAAAQPAMPRPRPDLTQPLTGGAPDALPAAQAAAGPQRETAVGNDLELIKSAGAAEGPPDEALARLTPDLPLELRLQVQGLLVDLGAKVESRGLKMTVPGGDLFAINSDTIEPTAHDTLAKVAELIDAYDGREVMIVGHTDSIGDEAYNQTLSQRRAELVKQFFVDNFDIEATRLSTDGRGEAQPIATNATVAGRQANRRVEVLILD